MWVCRRHAGLCAGVQAHIYSCVLKVFVSAAGAPPGQLLLQFAELFCLVIELVSLRLQLVLQQLVELHQALDLTSGPLSITVLSNTCSSTSFTGGEAILQLLNASTGPCIDDASMGVKPGT